MNKPILVQTYIKYYNLIPKFLYLISANDEKYECPDGQIWFPSDIEKAIDNMTLQEYNELCFLAEPEKTLVHFIDDSQLDWHQEEVYDDSFRDAYGDHNV